MGRSARPSIPPRRGGGIWVNPDVEPWMPEQEDIDRAVAQLRAEGLDPGSRNQPPGDVLKLARSIARARSAQRTQAQRARRRALWRAAAFVAVGLAVALLVAAVLS